VPEYVGGNRLTLLKNGEQYFPALLAAIDAAQVEVFLETYIFADDRIGNLVADALVRTAARGVTTRLLIDGFGAHDFASRFRDRLSKANADVLVFGPEVSPWPPWRQRTRLHRMHRKLACVDGAVAFVGGINIIDDYDTPDQTPPRYDYAVRIEGPLAARVRAEASKFWARVSLLTFGRRWRLATLTGRAARHALPPPGPDPGSQRAALVVRDNLRHRRDIEEAYLELIDAAREEAVIASAYFFPGRRFRIALARAARGECHGAAARQGRIPAAVLRLAGAIWPAAPGGRPDPGIPPQFPTREGRGLRRPHRQRRFVEHRSVQPVAGSGSKRLRRRCGICRKTPR
jgi:cardiolipin synthase